MDDQELQDILANLELLANLEILKQEADWKVIGELKPEPQETDHEGK